MKPSVPRGTISYVLDTTVNPPTIAITTDLHAESSSAGTLYGFVLSGTTEDGFHAYTGMNNAIFNDPDPLGRNPIDCSTDATFNTCQTTYRIDNMYPISNARNTSCVSITSNISA